MSIQAALKSPYLETSRKQIVRSVLEVLFYCGLCSFFKKIALKTNMFMIAAMVFSGLVYHWQGNYIEFSNYPFILTTSAIIAVCCACYYRSVRFTRTSYYEPYLVGSSRGTRAKGDIYLSELLY